MGPWVLFFGVFLIAFCHAVPVIMVGNPLTYGIGTPFGGGLLNLGNTISAMTNGIVNNVMGTVGNVLNGVMNDLQDAAANGRLVTLTNDGGRVSSSIVNVNGNGQIVNTVYDTTNNLLKVIRCKLANGSVTDCQTFQQPLSQ